MAKKRKKQEDSSPPPAGAPEWMVTYSDMVTLLMCFFVLLYSMATISTEKFEQINRSLQMTFKSSANAERFDTNVGKDPTTVLQNPDEDKDEKEHDFEQQSEADEDLNEIDELTNEELIEFIEKLEELILELDLGEYIEVLNKDDSIILRINSVILFDLGEAEVKEDAIESLTRIGLLLNTLTLEILIQGHSDDLPINTELYPSNWELSSRRATNIVRFLIERSDVNPNNLTATANAEFQPIAPNDSPENRQKNRRIDVVIPKF